MLYSNQCVDDQKTFAMVYAAQLIALDDIEAAAGKIFDMCEAVIHDDKEYKKTAEFVLTVTKIIEELDPDYNAGLALAYYNLVKSRYLQLRQLSWIEQQPSKLWVVGSSPTRSAIL